MVRIGFLDTSRLCLTEREAPGFEYTPGVFRKQLHHDYHPQTRWCFTMNTKDRAFREEKIKKNTTAEFYSINLDEPTVMYKAPVSIYNPRDEDLFGFDYWYNEDYVRIDDSIFYILSDYAGLRVYDTCLRIVFDLPVSRSMSRYADVYGFHFDYDSRRLISWIVIDERSRKPKGIRRKDTDSEDEEKNPRPKFNYDDVSLVPEEKRAYHNVFAVVHG